MMWIAIAFIALSIIVCVVGRSLWIAGSLLIHSIAMLLWFNTGWGYTVVPAVLACVIFWVAWTVKSRRGRETSVT